MTDTAPVTCDLCVIGSGMAGMSAALFAVDRGLSTVLVGRTGEIIFATGFLDLMGVHPLEAGTLWNDPWAGIAALVKDLPQHPYARLSTATVRAAFQNVIKFFETQGLSYTGFPDRNAAVLTAVGTVKLTYRVPLTMWSGVTARQHKAACLLVDIQGLKGFSARQIKATVGGAWPDLRTVKVAFPGAHPEGDVFPERLARSLETAGARANWAAVLEPHIQGAAAIGVPAILGISRSAEVMQDLEKRLGCQVFEIPTMPPGVTGLRMKEAFERGLAGRKVRLLLENKVFRAAHRDSGFLLEAGSMEPDRTIQASAVLLATGRFMGGGLQADRHAVREPIFNLPVQQPERRDHWHRENFLDRRGHPVNRAGLQTDEFFRPIDATGRPVHPRLFAAGSILAHQDWIRMKCGSGLAFSTAYAAVENALAELNKG
ncbi:MAG: glycerol-3-phosphate dehydrogenase subunit GlpB [Desulfobacterales bacterium]|nr:glycerol-3-phosphate dehydrogenase subunit GlpB [Desulfobacterales bacterium]